MGDDFSQYRYRNRHRLTDQFRRLIWSLMHFVLIKWTPRWACREWRSIVLRLAGAKIGQGCSIDPTCKIWAPWNLELGDYVCLAEGVDCYCVGRVSIGSKCTVSQRAFLCTATHDISMLTRELIVSPIRIEPHAWICAEAFVGPGVLIATGAIVGARAAVFRDIEAWTVVGGVPARFLKQRVIT